MATVDEILASVKATMESGEATVVAQLTEALATLVVPPVGGVMSDEQKAVIADVIAKLQALIA